MKNSVYGKWIPVIGLEIHVQLKTQSKIFARSPNHFGDEPNTNIEFVDTGQPGILPVLNRAVIDKAILFGHAIQGEIAEFSTFDRKSYFYPDSPKGYQITQHEHPIIKGGQIISDVDGETKIFQIDHAHLEEDAGMLKHFSNFSGVDYNRSGIPLLEIVSQPCMFSAKEAVLFATTLKTIMEYLDLSDCTMEAGSLRIDVNVSVRLQEDKELRNKAEIKNLNSFSAMETGIEAEVLRQICAYTDAPNENPYLVIPNSTVRLDVDKKKTIVMRSKEKAKDYRYCHDPDLPPIILTKEEIAKIKTQCPELPHERFKRYTEQLQLTPYNASILINDKMLSDYFEQAIKHCNHPTNLCNWITVEFVGRLRECRQQLPTSGILPQHIATLVSHIDQKRITGPIAKAIADIMVQHPGKDPQTIIKENPHFQPIHDHDIIESIVDQIIQENAQSVEDFKKGKDKAFNFLIGQIMKRSKGKASPDIVKEVLMKKILS